MEARGFHCEACGTRFTIPAAALASFPNWRPKRCRACRGQRTTERSPGRLQLEGPQPGALGPGPVSPAAPVNIYAQGSCEPNPGDGGWAAVKVMDGRIIREASGFEPQTTSNRMELTAVLEGLRMTAPDEDAVIWTASEFCFKTATVWAAAWSQNGWRKGDNKPVPHVDLVREMHALLQRRPRVRVEWRPERPGDPWSASAAAAAVARRSGGRAPATPRPARV